MLWLQKYLFLIILKLFTYPRVIQINQMFVKIIFVIYEFSIHFELSTMKKNVKATLRWSVSRVWPIPSRMYTYLC